MTHVRDKAADDGEAEELRELAESARGSSTTSTTGPSDVQGSNSATLEAAASRPSKTNCTTRGSDCLQFDSDDSDPSDLSLQRRYWRRKNELVNQFLDEDPDKAARPVSVRDDVKIREDAAAEKQTDGITTTDDPEMRTFRGAPWSKVLRSFLSWYNGYRQANLLFRDPDGQPVRAPMENSHQPRYGDKYYAKLKALERQTLEQYDNPHVGILTLTGSSRNSRGGWRCPADHLRDVVDSWRPDRGRGVYHALRDALDDADAWEYALVTEHHKSGYGHVHVALFVDGEIAEEDFHGVIDAHLRNCEIAGADAHDYHDPDPEVRPISVSRVDPDADHLDDPDDADNTENIANAASYVAEYVGAFGEELFDRSISELQFRAVCWATGTQRVRFSQNASNLIADDLDDDRGDDLDASNDSLGWKPGTDADALEEAATDDDYDLGELVDGERGWSLAGIERCDEDGPELYSTDRTGVTWVTLDDASHLDPPKVEPFSRPRPRTDDTELTAYASTDD